MIKKFNEYSINENLNGFQNGDVVEVISIFGETENLNNKNSKFLGRIYVVDYTDEHSIHTLGGGTWKISDVRKLSHKEIEKRQPEIQEIYSAWEKKKSDYKQRKIEKINREVKSIAYDLQYQEESITMTEEVSSPEGNKFIITLNIQKID